MVVIGYKHKYTTLEQKCIKQMHQENNKIISEVLLGRNLDVQTITKIQEG